MNRKKQVFCDTVKRSRVGIAVLLLAFLSSGAVFYLYGLPLEPFLYAAALIVFWFLRSNCERYIYRATAFVLLLRKRCIYRLQSCGNVSEHTLDRYMRCHLRGLYRRLL